MKGLRNKFKKKHSLNDSTSTAIEKFTKTDDSVQALSIHSIQSPANSTNKNKPNSSKLPEKPSAKTPAESPSSSPKKLLARKHLMSLTPSSSRKSSYLSVSASSSPIGPSKKSPDKSLRGKKDGILMTSFSSMQNLSRNDFVEKKSDSAFSSMDPLTSTPKSFRNLSLSSTSSSQGSSPSVFSSSQTSNQLRSALSDEKTGRDNKRSSTSGLDSLPESHHSGFLKNLKFNKKEKGPVKKQISKEEGRSSMRHAASLSNLSAESRGTEEILEQFKEHYKTLEIEVRGKDEEVRMLNATIDQVNQTWENKVHAMMKDLEQTKKHNEHLRERLQKENSNSSLNANKPVLRIPVKPMQKKQSSTTHQAHLKGSDDDNQGSSVYSRVVSPRANRKGIREPNRRMGVAVRHGAKSDDIRQKLLHSLKSSPCLSQLSSGDLNCIADVMKAKKVITGERLMQEGVVGQAFYVLADGECRIFKHNQESVSRDLIDYGRSIRHWEIIGEADVFYHTRRVWSCKCIRPGTVWYITREEFRSAIMQQDILQRQRKEIFNFLNQVKSLEKLKPADFKLLATVSKVVHFAKGDYIIRQGSSLTSIFLLKEGEVTLTRMIDGSETRVETLKRGSFLGASTAGNRHQHNALASGKEVVQCVAIPYKHFNKIRDHVSFLLNDVTLTKISASLARQSHLDDGQESICSDITGSSSGYGSDQSSPNPRRRNQKRYDEAHSIKFSETSSFLKSKADKDFETLALVGNGAFGSVTLAKVKNNNENVFAVKKLSKHEVVAAEQQQNVFSEKTLQMDTSRDCPFIVSLYSTFKDNRFVYFVMEFCPGGELFSLLSSANSFDDDSARFYASCVLEALAFLHSRRIVFRDLKPENVVIDKDGYCKLTDFGFAKTVSKSSSLRTYTYCGTPEYMAPETILYHAQSFPVDIWALGIFIFELLDGKAPFRDKNRVALADLILAGIEPMLQKSRDAKRIVNPAALSIIKELCRIRPEDRLGYGKGGIIQIAKHCWFQKTKWEALRQRRLAAPWKPKLRSLQDTHYFKPGAKCEQMQDAEEEFSGWDANF